jgi:hypothetical protein
MVGFIAEVTPQMVPSIDPNCPPVTLQPQPEPRRRWCCGFVEATFSVIDIGYWNYLNSVIDCRKAASLHFVCVEFYSGTLEKSSHASASAT